MNSQFVDWRGFRLSYNVAEQSSCLVAVLFLCCKNLLRTHFSERSCQQFGRCLCTEHVLNKALVNISNAEEDIRGKGLLTR